MNSGAGWFWTGWLSLCMFGVYQFTWLGLLFLVLSVFALRKYFKGVKK